MEFLASYALAKAPYSAYQVEPPPQSQRSKPARSNSTSGTSSTTKRSRIPGHARTSSSGGRTENLNLNLNLSLAQTHNAGAGAGWLQRTQGRVDASGASADAAPAIATLSAAGREGPSTDQHDYSQQQQQQQQHQQQQHLHLLDRDPCDNVTSRDRDRMPASAKYYQDKQLPATPLLNTQDTSPRYSGAGDPSEPVPARTPASASATAAAAFPDRRMLQPTAMYPDATLGAKLPGAGGVPRAESVSSFSGATTTSNRTTLSTEHVASSEASTCQLRPFVVRNGRTYISDPTLPYPLPVDLEELHRQTLKTLLLLQLYGRPICAPAFEHKPPLRILEVGCGSGFWSLMCYKYYEARGLHKDISFTGLDIVPLPPAADVGFGAKSEATAPDKDMNWRFVQHDLRKRPLPFPDGSFDFVMVKDMGLATSMTMQQGLVEEYTRILSPGGTIEIWETDHVLRMLRPHVPESATTTTTTTTTTSPSSSTLAGTEGGGRDEGDGEGEGGGQGGGGQEDTSGGGGGGGGGGQDETKVTTDTGAYVMTSNTPLSTPLNTFLVEYNGWVTRALDARALCAVPCALVGSLLVQEAEALTGVGSRRLAVPLSEVRWEREGVGGVVTKDGKSYIETRARRLAAAAASGKDGTGAGAGGGAGGAAAGKALDPAAAALRRTALLIVVQEIQSLEPILREVSGKNQDEWDAWMGKMMNDLVRENGTSWGECLEVGAWWARKR